MRLWIIAVAVALLLIPLSTYSAPVAAARRHVFLLAGLAVTPPAMLISFLSAGRGHGSYVLARLVMPWACMAVGLYFPGAGAFVLALALLQWPVYGGLIDLSKRSMKMIASVSVLHAMLCVWLFTRGKPDFS